jgi:arabinan endo-1,5-alpha-L-arabinosidase
MHTIRNDLYLIFACFILQSCNLFDKSKEDTISEQTTQLVKEFYTNPVYNKDFADPTVIKAANGYYYGYATNRYVNDKNVNIQVIKSKNLVDWEIIGDAMPTKPTRADKDFWAPHVLYDSAKKLYFLYYSGESNTKEGKCLGVATSSSAAGPFIDKGEPLIRGEGFVNIDPMAFDDPVSGKKLLYWGSGFKAIKVRELAADRLSFKEGTIARDLVYPIINDSPENYQNLVEGAWVSFHESYYYLYFSGDNCCGDMAHYVVMVARSNSPTGPFEIYTDISKKEESAILYKNNKWIALGHNSVITDSENQEWIVYHAIDAENRNKGRVMLIDKINYSEGWPVINSGTPSIAKSLKPIIHQIK